MDATRRQRAVHSATSSATGSERLVLIWRKEPDSSTLAGMNLPFYAEDVVVVVGDDAAAVHEKLRACLGTLSICQVSLFIRVRCRLWAIMRRSCKLLSDASVPLTKGLSGKILRERCVFVRMGPPRSSKLLGAFVQGRTEVSEMTK